MTLLDDTSSGSCLGDLDIIEGDRRVNPGVVKLYIVRMGHYKDIADVLGFDLVVCS